jgi:hypothetical protein
MRVLLATIELPSLAVTGKVLCYDIFCCVCSLRKSMYRIADKEQTG